MKHLKRLVLLAVTVAAAMALLCVCVSAGDEESTSDLAVKVGEESFATFNEAVDAVTEENNVITVLKTFTAESAIKATATPYTVQGLTGSEIVIFPESATFPESGSVTFKSVHVRTNGSLKISGSVSVTFGEGAYLTGKIDEQDAKKNTGVIYGYERAYKENLITISGTASLSFNSGSQIYWTWANYGITVNTGATLNINSAVIKSAAMSSSLVKVSGGTLNVSGATTSGLAGMSNGLFYVASGSASFTGTVTGGSVALKTESPDYVTIDDAACFADLNGDGKTYISNDTIRIDYTLTTTATDGTTSTARKTIYTTGTLSNVIQNHTNLDKLNKAGNNASDYTFTIYKDHEFTAENAVSRCIFTLNGNGHKVTINESIVGIYNNTGEEATVTFNNVVIKTGNINIGAGISLVFGDKAVLTTENEQVTRLFNHYNGTGTVTFKTGSRIEDINCKEAPIKMGTANLIAEEGVTLEGKIYVRPYEAETSGRKFEKGIAFVTSSATGNSIAPGSLGLVARIGQNYYHRFANAVTAAGAANGATVELLDNCTYLNDGYDLSGALDWTLNGNSKTLKMEKVFSVAGNASVHSTVAINNLNIDLASTSGGFSVSGSYLTLNNVTVTQSQYSPAYFIQSTVDCSVVTLNNSSIDGISLNVSVSQSAAIKMVNGKVVLNNTIIKNCTGQNGGAVALHNSSSLEMTGGQITGNKATLGAGILCYDADHTLKFSGNASVINNQHVTDGTELNICLNGCTGVTLADGFSGKLYFTKDDAKNSFTTGAQIGSMEGTLGSGYKLIEDRTLQNTIFIPGEESAIIALVVPTLNVSVLDYGMYSDTEGVVRFSAVFSGISDYAKIEKCGMYFLKSTTNNPGKRNDGTQIYIDEVTETVTDGMGMQYDCYGMAEGDNVYVIAWYKLEGLDVWNSFLTYGSLTAGARQIEYDVPGQSSGN